jgi:hypothetical protein
MNIYISATILIIFLTYIVCSYRVLPSISNSFYATGQRPIFFIAMVSFSIPLLYGNESIYLALSVMCIWLLATASAYHERLGKLVHYPAAFMAVVWAMLHVWIDLGRWDLVAAFVIASINIILIRKNVVWWVEIAAFVTFYTAKLWI